MAVKVHMTMNKLSTFVGAHWASDLTKGPAISTPPMHIWALPSWAPRVAWPPRLQQRHKGFLLGSPMVWTLIKVVEFCILPTAVGITGGVNGDKTRRLVKYDPKSKKTTILLKNLTFPNGITLTKNGDFILVADTTNCKILRLWLKSSKSGIVEDFAHLLGFPDNIRRNLKREFWVTIHAKRGKILKWLLSCPWLGNALIEFPFDITKLYSYLPKWRVCGLAVRMVKCWKCWKLKEEMDGNLLVKLKK
ncbi:Protein STRICTOSIDINE SYNTHASE-LIKE 10 [Camellia lanceoleosa]|uniref:Protein STRICTOSIDINE SYNTHASE-LIKE 10 n=1 Tax=Camellia lanceoleosa TaxID=1840588 RepID=A0ACC0FST1_9ERIC|nr:Protein STRICTOSIDINE SYNTHASE-LIKE 10 [Camellia lanceoleosa]